VTTAREEILRRIRAATAGVPAGEPAAWDPDADDDPAAAYHRAPPQPPGAGALVARFAERVAEYRAEVTTADRDVWRRSSST